MAWLLLFLGCDVRKRWYLLLVSCCGRGLRDRLDGLEVPDLLRILADGAVAGEDAGASGVQHGLADPFVAIAVVAIDLLVNVDVAAQISEMQIALIVRHERIVDAAEEAGLAGRKDIVG